METLEAFVHYENLILFKKQLEDARITERQKQLILRLLAIEQAKDFPLLRIAAPTGVERPKNFIEG